MPRGGGAITAALCEPASAAEGQRTTKLTIPDHAPTLFPLFQTEERLYSVKVRLALLVTVAASTAWASVSPSGRRGIVRRTVGEGRTATKSRRGRSALLQRDRRDGSGGVCPVRRAAIRPWLRLDARP